MRNRGLQRVHTVACYQDTWEKFNSYKHSKGMTADEVLNYLVDNINKYDRDYLINVKRNIDAELENKIKKL